MIKRGELIMILNTLTLGFIFALLGFGIFLSFKILNFTDLTAEASFTLGGAIAVMCCQNNLSFLGILLSFIGGAGAGTITALLHTKLHIDKVLAGILTLTAFYTINLWVTGLDPNMSLDKKTLTIFPRNNDIASLFIAIGIVVLVGILLFLFFKTKTGLSVRACGDNETMIETQSVNIDNLKIIGLALSNGLIALSGALFMEQQRYYDSSFGTGMMVVGVATIIMGESLIRFRHSLPFMLLAISLGSIIYRFIYILVLQLGGEPTTMKLISALCLVICICLSKIKFKKKVNHNAYVK